MNHKQILLDLFNLYGGKLTLGQLLAHPSGVGYKCTTRFSELREEGFQIDCIKGSKPSDNTYVLRHYDKNGQGQLL